MTQKRALYWLSTASRHVLLPAPIHFPLPQREFLPSGKGCQPVSINCLQQFPEPRPEWRAPSRTRRTRPPYSSYQSSGFRPHTRCPHPGRAQRRRCQRPRSRCLPETWTRHLGSPCSAPLGTLPKLQRGATKTGRHIDMWASVSGGISETLNCQ
uniref:Uncharacterized protein n=1 Tax=Ursus maritimus TaxID=29073 RepID=A0A452UUY5_URSMA